MQNKKISVTMILSSLLLFALCYLIKSPYDYNLIAYFANNNMNVPFSEYYILWEWLSLEKITIVTFITLSLGIYLYIYKTDDVIRKKLTDTSEKKKILFNRFRIRDLKLRSLFSESYKESLFKTDEMKSYEAIIKKKNKALGFGLIFLLLFIAEYSVAYNDSGSFLVIIILLLIIQKFVGAYLCHSLAPYNLGSSWFWFLFGFIIPSVALILASSRIVINKETELLYNKLNK